MKIIKHAPRPNTATFRFAVTGLPIKMMNIIFSGWRVFNKGSHTFYGISHALAWGALIPIFLAAIILLAAVPTSAQTLPLVQVNNVPASGYSGTDKIIQGDMWNEYVVDVPKGHELVYSFQVIGNGSIRVLIVNEVGTQSIINAQLNYYIEFSTSEPVTSYSATFPPSFSLNQDYTILVANTSYEEVNYSASISINEVDAPDYTIYYVLILLGLVGIVVFSWIIVNRQEREKKQAEQAAKDNRKGRKGRRR